MATKPEKPTLVVFSSGKLVNIAEAIRDNLARDRAEGVTFEVTPWTEGFFRSNEISLNTFLKNLLRFDAAVVILGADDLRQSTKDGGATLHVPRDNVIFELGACMARLGTQKTFIVIPETPEIVLPSYFEGIYPLKYETRQDGNRDASVGQACRAIREQFAALDRNAYYSDLPAQGLAFGYFFNFVSPVYKRLRTCENPLDVDGHWLPTCKFSVKVVIPREFLGRDKVDEACTDRGLVKLDLKLMDGRNISVYRKRRSDPTQPLEIFDIPTTLLTSRRVIERVDAFWGTGERKFKEQLERREITNFCRAISDIIAEDRDVSATCVKVISMDEFEEPAK